MNSRGPVTLDQPTAQFWPELMAIAVDIMILAAIGSWVFSQAKRAFKGEEVEKPF